VQQRVYQTEVNDVDELKQQRLIDVWDHLWQRYWQLNWWVAQTSLRVYVCVE